MMSSGNQSVVLTQTVGLTLPIENVRAYGNVLGGNVTRTIPNLELVKLPICVVTPKTLFYESATWLVGY